MTSTGQDGVASRYQVSEGKGSGHEELYGCGGQRIELRGRRSEVRGQKEDDRRRKAEDRRSSCGSGFLAAISSRPYLGKSQSSAAPVKC